MSSSDLPLLVTIRDLSRRLLTSLIPASSPSSPNIQPANVTTPVTAVTPQQLLNHPPTKPQSSQSDEFRIGFITPPFKDSKIPVTDHLHAHAYILPADRMGWWRSVGFGPLAWYSIDDLIAEIRYVILFNLDIPVHSPHFSSYNSLSFYRVVPINLSRISCAFFHIPVTVPLYLSHQFPDGRITERRHQTTGFVRVTPHQPRHHHNPGL